MLTLVVCSIDTLDRGSCLLMLPISATATPLLLCCSSQPDSKAMIVHKSLDACSCSLL